MFKFNKGDKVVIYEGRMFAAAFGGPADNSISEPCKITACRVHNGINQYKLKGYTSWCDEEYLGEA